VHTKEDELDSLIKREVCWARALALCSRV